MASKEPQFSQFVNIDPLYDSEQTARYHRVKQEVTVLTNLSKSIVNFLTFGRKFSAALLELHEKINEIDEVQLNSSYCSLSETLVGFNMLLMNHLNQVEGSMHVPIQSFLKHDLKSLKNIKNDYFAKNEKYNDFKDKMINGSKKTLTQEKRQKLMDLHKQDSHTLCDYVLQLDVTESRYNNLIGSLLVNYTESVAGEQGQQLMDLYKAKKQDIEIIQEAIRKSNEDITQKMFENNKTHVVVDEQMNEYYSTLDKPFVGEPATQIQGYLWKKKNGPFGNQFEKVFCVCREGFLATSTSPQTCARPLWTLQLIYCDIKPIEDDDRPNCFAIISRDKAVIMQAQSLHERETWIATLMKSKNGQFECGNNESDAENESGFVCADCGQKGADWLITNKGFVVCNQCGSCHRSFSSSTSRVRSLKMDTNTSIDQYSIELMHHIGNDTFNSIMEDHVTDKITPEATREEREAFLHKKYIDKAFMSTEKVDLATALKTQNIKDLLHCILDGSITEKFSGGLNALHAASIIGSPLMAVLIASNCPSMINELDDNRWTPLMYATYYNHIFVVDALIIYNADPTVDCLAQPYVIAASNNYEEIAERLVQYRPESFEKTEVKAPETEFEPEEVELSHFRKPHLQIYEPPKPEENVTQKPQHMLGRKRKSLMQIIINGKL